MRGVGWRTSIAARIPYSPGTAPPLLGEQTEQVLTDVLGWDAAAAESYAAQFKA